MPSLTEERRKELSRHVHKLAEEGRNSVRQVRRDANERLKKLLKDHKISEDDEKKGLDEVQKITDNHIKHDRRAAEEEGRGAAGQMTAVAVWSKLRQIADSIVSFFTHLECSVPCGAPALDPRETASSLLLRRAAARPLRPRRARARWSRDSARRTRADDVAVSRADAALRRRAAGHARRRVHAALPRAGRSARTLGLERLYIKDESLNPTNSFKARGQSAAITRAKYLGATTIALPTAGNAGNAAAAYAARAGLACEVFMPKDAKRPFVDECRLYGANVTLVDGLITDAGRMAAETRRAARLVRRLDAEGAVSHRRQEDDGLRARRADGLALARLDRLSDRRRHRHGRHVEGVRRARAHRLDAAGAGGRGWCRCRPRAARRSCARFEQGAEKAQPWEGATTIADGLRVPRAIGDFLILRAVRESGGTALAVSDAAMVDGMLAIGKHEGISAAPEGGAALAAIQRLVADGTIKPHESVVLFNTGGALKYLDVHQLVALVTSGPY